MRLKEHEIDTEEKTQRYLEMIREAKAKGISLKEAFHLSHEDLEGVYFYAYGMYNSGNYKLAASSFLILMLLEPKNTKYIFGLAATYQMQKEFELAIPYYALCTVLDTTNPVPYYHLFECYYQLDKPDNALFSIQMAIEIAGEQPKYSHLKGKCMLLLKPQEEAVITYINENFSDKKEK